MAREAPGKTIEARERQMIALAVDQAESMLREGRAPTQVLVHYLRLGASDYQLQKERLRRQNDLLRAKTESLMKQDQMEQLAKDAIEAMQRYSGNYGQEEVYDG